jgi:hypothetical protein
MPPSTPPAKPEEKNVVRKWLVHAVMRCEVCGKEWEDYLTAQNRAWTHAHRTGHLVKGELGYAVEYKGTAHDD